MKSRSRKKRAAISQIDEKQRDDRQPGDAGVLQQPAPKRRPATRRRDMPGRARVTAIVPRPSASTPPR